MTRIFEKNQSFDPIPFESLSEFSGIELLQQMVEGKLPPAPIGKTMNFAISSAEKGLVVFKGIPMKEHYNPSGAVHGGWFGTILDSAMGCAVHSMLDPGQAYSTIEYKINLVRPLFETSGEVICQGEVAHFGRSIATATGTLKDKNGKLIAHGTETCAVFPLRRKT